MRRRRFRKKVPVTWYTGPAVANTSGGYNNILQTNAAAFNVPAQITMLGATVQTAVDPITISGFKLNAIRGSVLLRSVTGAVGDKVLVSCGICVVDAGQSPVYTDASVDSDKDWLWFARANIQFPAAGAVGNSEAMQWGTQVDTIVHIKSKRIIAKDKQLRFVALTQSASAGSTAYQATFDIWLRCLVSKVS